MIKHILAFTLLFSSTACNTEVHEENTHDSEETPRLENLFVYEDLTGQNKDTSYTLTLENAFDNLRINYSPEDTLLKEYASIEALASTKNPDNPEFLERISSLKAGSKQLREWIYDLKDQLLELCENEPQNQDSKVVDELMIGQENGLECLNKISTYRKFGLSLIEPSDTMTLSFAQELLLFGSGNESPEEIAKNMFGMAAGIQVLSYLSKITSDLFTFETTLLRYLKDKAFQ